MCSQGLRVSHLSRSSSSPSCHQRFWCLGSQTPMCRHTGAGNHRLSLVIFFPTSLHHLRLPSLQQWIHMEQVAPNHPPETQKNCFPTFYSRIWAQIPEILIENRSHLSPSSLLCPKSSLGPCPSLFCVFFPLSFSTKQTPENNSKGRWGGEGDWE